MTCLGNMVNPEWLMDPSVPSAISFLISKSDHVFAAKYKRYLSFDIQFAHGAKRRRTPFDILAERVKQFLIRINRLASYSSKNLFQHLVWNIIPKTSQIWKRLAK